MDNIKKEIYVAEYSLDTDTEHTIDDINKKYLEGKEYYEKYYGPSNPNYLIISHYKIQAVHEYEEYGSSEYTRFYIKLYRMETDKELEIRLAKESEKAKRDEENKIKSQARAKQLAQEKAEKQAKLDTDPEYQKFIELQKKFK